MAWLCTSSENIWMQTESQLCIVMGPNLHMVIKLIRALKYIIERKLGLTFTNKETVLKIRQSIQRIQKLIGPPENRSFQTFHKVNCYYAQLGLDNIMVTESSPFPSFFRKIPLRQPQLQGQQLNYWRDASLHDAEEL
jgi:superfamily I DNA/RNA helicase